MLSLSSPAGAKNPGRLASQIVVEYLFPIVPPGVWAEFIVSPQSAAAARGLPIYMIINYRIKFGYMVPGAFQLTASYGGSAGYTGTMTGHQLEEGADILVFQEPDIQIIFYIVNLTNLNQYFQMNSHYLIITSENDYKEFKNQLERLHFPYQMPEPYPGVV